MAQKKKRTRLQIDIITLFPSLFASVFGESLIKKAQEKKIVGINLVNLRDFAKDKHKTVDDKPYGGGSGMVLRPDILAKAIEAESRQSKQAKVILLTPQGKVFEQKTAKRLANESHLILVCGHYEGVDERVHRYLVDEEISIGDYILTGGEIPAMVLVDSIVRLIPGVVGKKSSVNQESLEGGLLKYPVYTKPFNFRGHKVPQILLSGDHQKIFAWRQKQKLARTTHKRPDLLKKLKLTKRVGFA